MEQLPSTGFLRLPQILGQTEVTPDQAVQNKISGKGPRRPRPAIAPLIPVRKTTWWAGVKSGRFPKPIKNLLGARVTVWRVEDIQALINGSTSAHLWGGDKNGAL